jgi:DNA-binding MarR family transcriptional regulator
MNALRRIVRALRTSNQVVERTVGISAAQLFVLRRLEAAPRQSLTDLVESTLTHQSTVSEVVGRLVDAGLVRRGVAADDARRAELGLTAAGRALLRRAPDTVQSVLVDGFARLGASQRRALVDGLEAWLVAARLEDVPPTMFFDASPSSAKRRSRSPSRRHRDAG